MMLKKTSTNDTEAVVRTCIVHLIRYSMQFASWKERKAIAATLKAIYRVRTAAVVAHTAAGIRRRAMGPEICSHWAELAAQLRTSHSILCLFAGDAWHYVYYQLHREPE